MKFDTNIKMKITIEFELTQTWKTMFPPNENGIKERLIRHLQEFIDGGDDLKERLQDETIEFKEFSIPSNECWDCYDEFTITNVK